MGGECGKGVTQKTDFLVVGSFDYNLRIKGDATQKLMTAERYVEKGITIAIIGEEEFYELLEA